MWTWIWVWLHYCNNKFYGHFFYVNCPYSNFQIAYFFNHSFIIFQAEAFLRAAGAGTITDRTRRLAKQLPKQDLAAAHCRHLETKHKASFEDFIAARNEIALDIG